MESDGVIELYRRSVDKYGIRYNPFIGDGDSSAYSTVDKLRPYGALFFTEKRECVNHVTKRMGTNLRTLVRENKGNKLYAYRFTNATFLQFQITFIYLCRKKVGGRKRS